MFSLHRRIRNMTVEFEGIDPPDIDDYYRYERVEIRSKSMFFNEIDINTRANIYFRIISETARKFPEYVFSIVSDRTVQDVRYVDVVNILNRDREWQLNEYNNEFEDGLGASPDFRIYRYTNDIHTFIEHHTQRTLSPFTMNIDNGVSRGLNNNLVWGMYDHVSRTDPEMINRIFPELLRQTSNEFLQEFRDAYNLSLAFNFEYTEDNRYMDRHGYETVEDNEEGEQEIKRRQFYNDQERKKEALRVFAVNQYQPQMRVLPFAVRHRYDLPTSQNPLTFVKGMRQWFN